MDRPAVHELSAVNCHSLRFKCRATPGLLDDSLFLRCCCRGPPDVANSPQAPNATRPKRLSSETGRELGVNTSEPATSTLSSGFGVPGGSSFFQLFPIGLPLRGRDISRRFHEFRKLCIRDIVFIDPESFDLNFMRGPFVGKLRTSSVPMVNSPHGIQNIPVGAVVSLAGDAAAP